MISFVTAAQTSPKYASWGYQPLQSIRTAQKQTSSIAYGGTTYSQTTYGYGAMTGTTYTPFKGITQDLNYQFGTTSAYIHPAQSKPKRTNWSDNTMYGSGWNEDPSDDDDELGVVQNKVPVGDIPWLLILLFAVGYILSRRYILKK